MKSREVHLIARPEGIPEDSDFEIVEADVADPGDGEILVRTIYMSVDPAMRPRLRDQELGTQMMGGAIGRVEASNNDSFKVGDNVQGGFGFREYTVSDGKGMAVLKTDPEISLSAYMGPLGGTGYTAYGGILDIGKLQEGETLFVSTAAGAVGSVAAQMGKIMNCFVIGSTGSDEKVKWLLEEAKIDHAFNYKTQKIRAELDKAAPKGIDVYFENVGGDHLDATIPRMRTLGRIAVCGMISGYNNPGSRSEPVTSLASMIYGRVTMRGFVAPDFTHTREEFVKDMTGWLKDGKIKYQETIKEGIENASAALSGLFRSENIGKMLVRLSPED